MKRTMCEIAVVGGLLFLMASLYGELDSLREDGIPAAPVKAALPAPSPKPRKTPPVTRSDLQEFELRLAEVRGKLRKVEDRLEETRKGAWSRVSEAMGTSKELSRAIESAQKLVFSKQNRLAKMAGDLRRKLEAQEAVIADLRRELHRDRADMTRRMLDPTVQISGDETVGSGTIIASKRGKNGTGYRTWVLTAWHVIRNILTDEPERKRAGFFITLYHGGVKKERVGDLIAKNPSKDLALLLLRGGERIEAVARLMPESRIDDLEVWDPLFAVGCPLGNDPIPTGGFLANKNARVNGMRYWMINAPTYFGNSGGGIFHGTTHELIAVFSKIFTHGKVRPVVISHMGLAVPLPEVYSFLRETGHGDLIPASRPTEVPVSPGR